MLRRRAAWSAAALAGCVAAVAVVIVTGCRRPAAFQGPAALLSMKTAAGGAPRVGTMTMAAETRPVLTESAAFDVALPARPLLTFALGVAWSGAGEAPGW